MGRSSISIRAGLIFATAILAAAVSLPAMTSTAAASGQRPASAVATHQVQRAPAKVTDYWTAGRMRRADPVSVAVGGGSPSANSDAIKRPLAEPSYTSSQVTDPTAPGNRTSGKVFFHDPVDGKNYECSGTAIHSQGHDMVSTAGHCVFGGQFVTNWIFAPGYHDGTTPFGQWAASQLSAPQGWVSSITCTPLDNCANFDFDLGAAVTVPNGSGQQLEDVVGARRVGFDQSREQTYQAYGYPAEPNIEKVPPDFFGGPPFGEKLWSCVSRYGGSDAADPRGGPAPMLIGCDMTAGSSGGGWVVGDNCLEGLNSYGYSTQPEHLYGPYFGSAAQNVYGVPTPSAKTKLLEHPKSKTKKRRARFEFEIANAGSAELECFSTALECKLDSKSWKDCSGGHVTYKKLKRAKHRFKVRARISGVGVDSSPASFSFKVREKHD